MDTRIKPYIEKPRIPIVISVRKPKAEIRKNKPKTAPTPKLAEVNNSTILSQNYLCLKFFKSFGNRSLEYLQPKLSRVSIVIK